ncbi:MAG: IS200/IS605 family transposase [Dehalococcoidia bacterium]|nr:IS200/IS605 family transposase [Dehalococcoidia bacterium]
MPYWRLFYHIVWGTRDRLPVIEYHLLTALHDPLAGNASRLSAIVHAVGGVEDHIHLVTSVPPGIAISEFIRQLKGSSSHFVNHELAPPVAFAWQANYGVMSLDSKQLDRVVKYVKEQRKHHAQQTTIPVLERLSEKKWGIQTNPASNIQCSGSYATTKPPHGGSRCAFVALLRSGGVPLEPTAGALGTHPIYGRSCRSPFSGLWLLSPWL